MKNLSMFFSEHPYVFPALIGAILLTLLVIYVVRLISGRTGNAKIVTAVFEGLYDQVDAAGAWERERTRFPSYTDSVTGVTHPLAPREEIALIRQYIASRHALLDAAYGGKE